MDYSTVAPIISSTLDCARDAYEREIRNYNSAPLRHRATRRRALEAAQARYWSLIDAIASRVEG